jgi:hypothetical protein
VAQSDGKAAMRVIGVLAGQQMGQDIEIIQTVEINHSNPSVFQYDKAVFDQDIKIFQEVFPNHEILGWSVASVKLVFLFDLTKRLMLYPSPIFSHRWLSPKLIFLKTYSCGVFALFSLHFPSSGIQLRRVSPRTTKHFTGK